MSIFEEEFDVDPEKLKKQLNAQLDRTERNRKRDKARTKWITLSVACAGATTSSLIGLSQFFPQYDTVLQVAALVLSAAISVVVAWDKLFNHKNLWLLSARGYRGFKQLLDILEHAEGTDTLSQGLAKSILIECQKNIDKMNEEWDQLRAVEG